MNFITGRKVLAKRNPIDCLSSAGEEKGNKIVSIDNWIAWHIVCWVWMEAARWILSLKWDLLWIKKQLDLSLNLHVNSVLKFSFFLFRLFELEEEEWRRKIARKVPSLLGLRGILIKFVNGSKQRNATGFLLSSYLLQATGSKLLHSSYWNQAPGFKLLVQYWRLSTTLLEVILAQKARK